MKTLSKTFKKEKKSRDAHQEQEIQESLSSIYKKTCEEDKVKERFSQKSNLTQNESKGLKRQQKRITDKEIIIMKTDRMGRMAAVSREYYTHLGKEQQTKINPWQE